MALKLLAQVTMPVADTRTDIFAVSAYGSNSIAIKSWFVCCVGGSPFSLDLSLAPNGEAHANKHLLLAGAVIPSIGIQSDIQIGLQNGDVVRASSSVDNTTVSLFGEMQE